MYFYLSKILLKNISLNNQYVEKNIFASNLLFFTLSLIKSSDNNSLTLK